MALKKKLLMIEDEEAIVEVVKKQAEIAGYKLYVEGDGISGFRTAEKVKPDLILLDIMLPLQNGFDVCRKIRNHGEIRNTPIIIISAKGEEQDILLGLELGADDYVTKPFSLRILFSRIKAVLRRGAKGRVAKVQMKILSFGEFALEVDRYILRKKEETIPLTLSEFGILKKLLLHRGEVLTRSQLLEEVNHNESLIIDRNIDVHIASLRKKLGAFFPWVETVRGVGYRFNSKEPSPI